jgi:oligopeptide transport system permease protein
MESAFVPRLDDFLPATEAEKQLIIPQYQSVSYWKDAWQRLRRNHLAMVSLGAIVLLFVFAFLGPLAVPYSYEQQVRGSSNLAPLAFSAPERARMDAGEAVFPHIFGTDSHGRDILVRTMYGTRVSIFVGIAAAVLTLLVGGVYGAIAGYAGGKTGMVMMGIVDIIYSLPDILVVLLLTVTFKPLLLAYAEAHMEGFFGKLLLSLGSSIIAIFISFALLYWTGLARIVRGQVMQLKSQEYVIAAQALGVSRARIILRHLLPNCIGSLVAATCLQIPHAIFLESMLSFLGLGVAPPMTSLGSLVSDALRGMYSYPYRLIIPSIILGLLILSFNLFGDGLRDTLDPRLKK